MVTRLGVLSSALLTLTALSLAGAATRDARIHLWLTVSLKCMRHLAKSEAPIPCDSIENSLGWDRGVALLKDDVGIARMLAIPTHPVTGIEDPAVLSKDEPNYFAIGWATHFGFPMRLHAMPPAGAVAVVVESKATRREDQLNLVVDCLSPDFARTLSEQATHLTSNWQEGAITLGGRPFWARRVDGESAKNIWPFQLLADDLPGAKENMAVWSLTMAQPASFARKAFALLAARDSADARDILDPSCAVASNQ